MDAWLQNNLMHDPWTQALVVLIDSGVKGFVLLALAAIVTTAMRRASAASRHLVWALAMGGLMLLPALSLVSPKWQLPILPQATGSVPVAQMLPARPSEPARATGMAPAIPVADVAPGPPIAHPVAAPAHVPPLPAIASVQLSVSFWLLVGWLAVALTMLLPLLVGMAVVARLMRKACPFAGEDWPELTRLMAAAMGVRQPVRYLCTGRAVMPMATGLWRPTILLPPEADAWPEEKRRAVLLHELAHIKRRDCLIHALARLAVALHWLNPLAWLALRSLRIERERACDDLVLIAGERASAYADNLLDIALTMQTGTLISAAAITMAKKSQIEGRLLAILDATRNRRGVTRRGLALWLVLFCLTMLLFAAVEIGKRGPAGPPQLKVAVWSVFVSEPVARALQDKGTALAGKSDIYQGYAVEAKTLRAMLWDGVATSQVLCIPRKMVWLENCDPRTGHKVLPEISNICSTVKIDGNHLFFIDLPNFYMLTARDLQVHLEWQGGVQVEVRDNGNYGGEARPSVRFTGALNCDGDLKAEDVHIYLAPLAPPGDAQATRGAVRQLIAVQAVEVGAEDAPSLAAFVDLERWLQNGPEGALAAIHKARNLGKTAAAQNPRWTHPVPGGGMIRLRAVGQPAHWPFQWWNGDGQRITGLPDWQKSAATSRLVFYLDAQGIEGEIDLDLKMPGLNWWEGAVCSAQSDIPGPNLEGIALQPASPESNARLTQLLEAQAPLDVTVTCGVGEWQKITDIREGEEIRVDGGRFNLKAVTARIPKFLEVDGDYDFDPAWDVVLVGVDRKGQRSQIFTGIFKVGNHGKREGTRIDYPIQMDKSQLDHFVFLKRPVQSYTFTGIATSPERKAGDGGQSPAPVSDREKIDSNNTVPGSNSPAPASSPWRKSLTNGATVELAYLGIRRDQPVPWWQPDGTTISQPQEIRTMLAKMANVSPNWSESHPTPPDPNERVVCFKVNAGSNLLGNHRFDPQCVTLQMPPGAWKGGMRLTSSWVNAMLSIGGFSAMNPPKTLRVGVADGPWTVVDTYKIGSARDTGKEIEWDASIKPMTASVSSVEVTVRHNHGDDGRFFRVVEIGQNGSELPLTDTNPARWTETGSRKTIQVQITCSPDTIAEFQLQSSEYQWAEFPVPPAALSPRAIMPTTSTVQAAPEKVTRGNPVNAIPNAEAARLEAAVPSGITRGLIPDSRLYPAPSLGALAKVLTATLELAPSKPRYNYGEKINLRIRLKNISQKEVSIPIGTLLSTGTLSIVEFSQTRPRLAGSAAAPDHYLLQPGREVLLDNGSLTLLREAPPNAPASSSPRDWFIAPHGAHTLHYVIGSREWAGRLATAPVNIRLSDEAAALTPEKKLSWSEPVNGLIAAAEITPEDPAYVYGEQVGVAFHLKNVSGKPIHLSMQMIHWARPTLKTKDGSLLPHTELGHSGELMLIRNPDKPLAPGEEIVLRQYSFAICKDQSEIKTMFGPATAFVCAPGEYELRYEIKLPEWDQLTDAQKNTGFRVRRDDWTGTINTPPIRITVLGEGLPRHWNP